MMPLTTIRIYLHHSANSFVLSLASSMCRHRRTIDGVVAPSIKVDGTRYKHDDDGISIRNGTVCALLLFVLPSLLPFVTLLMDVRRRKFDTTTEPFVFVIFLMWLLQDTGGRSRGSSPPPPPPALASALSRTRVVLMSFLLELLWWRSCC